MSMDTDAAGQPGAPEAVAGMEAAAAAAAAQAGSDPEVQRSAQHGAAMHAEPATSGSSSDGSATTEIEEVQPASHRALQDPRELCLLCLLCCCACCADVHAAPQHVSCNPHIRSACDPPRVLCACVLPRSAALPGAVWLRANPCDCRVSQLCVQWPRRGCGRSGLWTTTSPTSSSSRWAVY